MTAQIRERLIIDGVQTSMAFCPPLPERHPRIISRELRSISTGCWRDYQGTWEIREGRFYLAGLAGRFELVGSNPLFAEWFTGVLRVPRGKMLAYVEMGFGSVYEEEVHIQVRRGVIAGTRVIDNRGKDHDPRLLGWKSLPGFENRFEGDGRRPGLGPLLARLLRRIYG